MTVYEAYNAFLYDKTVENCTEQTIKNYRYMLRYFVEYVGSDSLIPSIQYSAISFCVIFCFSLISFILIMFLL
jgi:hypothetical protein